MISEMSFLMGITISQSNASFFFNVDSNLFLTTFLRNFQVIVIDGKDIAMNDVFGEYVNDQN